MVLFYRFCLFFYAVFSVLFFFTSPLFIPFLVGKQEPYSSLVISLTKILFFFIVTSSLTSVFASISNSQQKFFVPSLSPILLNLIYLFSFLVCFPFIESSQQRIFFFKLWYFIWRTFTVMPTRILYFQIGSISKSQFFVETSSYQTTHNTSLPCCNW